MPRPLTPAGALSMKTGAGVKRVVRGSFLFAARVDRRRGGAGPGGAPAAAQRRGRTTWTRDEPAAAWSAAEQDGRRAPGARARVGGEPGSSLYRLLGGRTRSDGRGFAPGAHLRTHLITGMDDRGVAVG